MKNISRFLLALFTLGSALLLTSCAEFAEGLSAVAQGMQQQQQGSYGDGEYVHTPRNTSAPGIK